MVVVVCSVQYRLSTPLQDFRPRKIWAQRHAPSVHVPAFGWDLLDALVGGSGMPTGDHTYARVLHQDEADDSGQRDRQRTVVGVVLRRVSAPASARCAALKPACSLILDGLRRVEGRARADCLLHKKRVTRS
jgi:hypothetical protein